MPAYTGHHSSLFITWSILVEQLKGKRLVIMAFIHSVEEDIDVCRLIEEMMLSAIAVNSNSGASRGYKEGLSYRSYIGE